MRSRCSKMSYRFLVIISGALLACFLGYNLNKFTKGFILETTMNDIAILLIQDCQHHCVAFSIRLPTERKWSGSELV